MPSSADAVSAPEKSELPWTSAASAAACGGVSRESHTRTRAPWPAHQRAMARPEAPSPRISTFMSERSLTFSGLCQRSFRLARPTRHNSIVMIQKRITTCVSVQPDFSKWWCSGAIFRMRRPSPYLRFVYLK